MRRSLIACFVLLSSPSWAGCRLSTADCTVIAREMANEEIARIMDERRFHPPGMLAAPRALALLDRHFARKAGRYPHLPVRIANEWARMELCDAQDATVAGMDDQQMSAVLNGTAPNPIDPRCR